MTMLAKTLEIKLQWRKSRNNLAMLKKTGKKATKDTDGIKLASANDIYEDMRDMLIRYW